MQTAKLFAHIAIALALGALLVGRGLVIPALDQSTDLIDANLAKALAGPIHLRLAEVTVAATLVLCTLAQRWLGRWATSVALVSLGACAVYRWVLLPTLYAAWARADLVAGRPVEQLQYAERLANQELLLAGTIALLLFGLIVADCLESRQTTAPQGESSPTDAPLKAENEVAEAA